MDINALENYNIIIDENNIPHTFSSVVSDTRDCYVDCVPYKEGDKVYRRVFVNNLNNDDGFVLLPNSSFPASSIYNVNVNALGNIVILSVIDPEVIDGEEETTHSLKMYLYHEDEWKIIGRFESKGVHTNVPKTTMTNDGDTFFNYNELINGIEVYRLKALNDVTIIYDYESTIDVSDVNAEVLGLASGVYTDEVAVYWKKENGEVEREIIQSSFS